jgi:GNAT superfamily N-acetyltransferase
VETDDELHGMEYTISLTDNADSAIEGAITAPLIEYNRVFMGPSNWRTLAVLLRDRSNSVVGGLLGRTSYGWLFTEVLAIPEAVRGSGVGSQILERAEREAIARGCHGAWLDTHDLHAKRFYERHGYVAFSEIPDYPNGFSKVLMRKSLLPVVA